MSKSDPQYTLLDQFLDQPYSLAGRVIDPVSGTLSWQGKREHLRRKELEVLALLASAEGKQVSRENFIAVVWQGNDLVGDRGLTNTLFFLRRSMADESERPLIRTIPRRGYQLTATVQFLAAPDQQAIAEVKPQPVESLLAPGGTVADCPGWRLVRRLEQSPESEIWLAEPSEFGELDQGLRVFRFCRSEAQLQRLRREVTLLRYLTQTLSERSDIVLIRDWQLEEPPYYVVCDYANAGSLHDFIISGGLPSEPEKRLVLMHALAEALAAVHEHGVVHRKLSAQTVLVEQSDSGPKLLLSAFDLGALSDRTKLAALNITAAGLTMDSEALTAESATAADVYALGGVLLQLALADAHALPNTQCLEQVADAKLRALIADCFDGSATRPSAEVVASALARMASPDSQNGQSIAAESQAPATPIHRTTPPSQLAPASMPENIANYRLLDRLGEGGMGSVYLAEQHDPYRKVALKVIRAGLDGKQILSRFEAERQALALMNHPNVTTVLDTGLAADGKPYFAMEYVQGEEITGYCDAHHLNINARIKLFLQVCDGVLHAHQKGVLHRDIKPSNLMVSSAPDNAGTVKIIDFGLAKSLHGKLAAHTLHTSFGAFIGTPVYSSPEHVVGAASGVDTRSDIYSMGVVLYELLAGMTPIANESLANLEPEKIREIICKSKLPTMREQLQNTSEEKRKALAEHRAIKVDELPKTLEGDLSWVVGKCLERDPNDRYASVLALKEDLQRWLELRPVEARPTSGWYRFRKLVRRNRVTTGLICLVFSLLIATTTSAVWGFLKAERAARQASDAADQAQQILSFQQHLWEQLDAETMGMRLRQRLNDAFRHPALGASRSTASLAAPALLDQVNFTDLIIQQLHEDYFESALKTIEQNYAQRPKQQHFLRQSVAETLQSLGIHDRALQVQELALQQRIALLGPDADLTLQSLFHRGQILASLAQQTAAATDFQRVYQGLSVNHPNNHPAVVLVRFSAAQYNASPDEQVEIFRETLDQRLASHGADDQWVHRMRIALAYALTYRGRQPEALVVLTAQSHDAPRRSQMQRRFYVESLTAMGTIARQSNDIFAATRYFQQALDAAIEVYGSTHSVTLDAANALAYGLMFSGRAAEAESLMRKAQKDWRTIHGASNPLTIWFDSIIADAAWMQGRLQEATELMGVCANSMPSSHPMWFSIALYHGIFLRDIGRIDAAHAVLNKALDTTKDPQNRLWAQIELGKLEHIKGNLKRAEELLSAALAVAQPDAETFLFHQAASYLGAVWNDAGEIERARKLLEKTWAEQYSWEAIGTLRTLAMLESEQGNRAKALKHLQAALDLGRKHLDPRSLEWAKLQKTMATIEFKR